MNNPIVKLLIVVALVLGGGFYGRKMYLANQSENAHKMDLERIRKEYLERSPLARDMADPTKYREEMKSLWKWYFGELTDHYNKWGSFKNYERFLDDIDSKKKNKKIKDQEYAQYEERYKMAKGFWDMMKEGRYDPIWTASDKGLRFDIYKIEPVADAKEPKFRLWVALQGAQRKWNVDQAAGGPKVYKMNVNATFANLVIQGFDEKDKQLIELPVTGEPFKIDHPERWIEEFPPGIVFGYYDLPLFPAELERDKKPVPLAKLEFAFNVNTRSVVSGEEVAAAFTWKTPPLPSLKLAPGQKWEGATEEVREDGSEEGGPAAGKGNKKSAKR